MQPQPKEDKFNEITIIEEKCDGFVLVARIHKPISEEGYKENFMPRVKKIIEKYGEFRMLVYYEDFQGWEKDAASNDLEMLTTYGKQITKVAVVNPPKEEVFRSKVIKPMIGGEVKYFNEKDFDEALEWAKSD